MIGIGLVTGRAAMHLLDVTGMASTPVRAESAARLNHNKRGIQLPRTELLSLVAQANNPLVKGNLSYDRTLLVYV